MSQTTDNPVEQDDEARASRARLFRVLGLVRALAGPRGHATVTWWGQGFRYTLTADRATHIPYTVDADPDARNRAELAAALRARLQP